MSENNLRPSGKTSGRRDIGVLARQVSQLLQQQMDKLVDVPLAEWSQNEWDGYRGRREAIRKLRAELECPRPD